MYVQGRNLPLSKIEISKNQQSMIVQEIVD